MAFQKIVRNENESTDCFIEVNFLKPLRPQDITQVLQIVSDYVNDGIEQNMLEGLASIEVTELFLRVSFRYLVPTLLEQQGRPYYGHQSDGTASGPHDTYWFRYHLFEEIDKRFEISEHPFPVSLRPPYVVKELKPRK
jgi:hypothetical protein